MSRSSAAPPPMRAAIFPGSTRAPTSARSTRRWRRATTAASSSPRSSVSPMTGALKPMSVHVPGVLVDHVVVEPAQWQTTQTAFRPGHLRRDRAARRRLRGPRVRPREGHRPPRRHGARPRHGGEYRLRHRPPTSPASCWRKARTAPSPGSWSRGRSAGSRSWEFEFGCAANAEAIVPSPHQFTYLQGGGFDASLLSFLQIDREGNVNVSRLAARPQVTAGAGGFVDITANAPRIVFAGLLHRRREARHRRTAL